jgi:CDGSH-type Zn-finger protein
MPVTITVRNHGPLRIEGEFTVLDAEGRPYDLAGRTAMSFCRCGHSTNKPFCDGKTHKECGFDSAVEARALAPPAPKPAS